jgi:molecular chaperone DnaK
VPQIEVTFDIDVNGILKVTAKDKASGRMQHITITASSGLSKDEVERMRGEAEAHAEDDRQRKEKIEVRNTADNTVYSAEKLLKDYADKIPAEVKADVEANIGRVKASLEKDDVDMIRAATENLGQAIQKVGGSMYDSSTAQAGPGEQPHATDDVVDGEVKE